MSVGAAFRCSFQYRAGCPLTLSGTCPMRPKDPILSSASHCMAPLGTGSPVRDSSHCERVHVSERGWCWSAINRLPSRSDPARTRTCVNAIFRSDSSALTALDVVSRFKKCHAVLGARTGLQDTLLHRTSTRVCGICGQHDGTGLHSQDAWHIEAGIKQALLDRYGEGNKCQYGWTPTTCAMRRPTQSAKDGRKLGLCVWRPALDAFHLRDQ